MCQCRLSLHIPIFWSDYHLSHNQVRGSMAQNIRKILEGQEQKWLRKRDFIMTELELTFRKNGRFIVFHCECIRTSMWPFQQSSASFFKQICRPTVINTLYTFSTFLLLVLKKKSFKLFPPYRCMAVILGSRLRRVK